MSSRETSSATSPAETAISPAVHALLDTVGISFTIVGPHQIGRAPGPGSLGRIAGRDATLVVYDGPTSHALAFGSALGSAEALADQLATSAGTGLTIAATDLETFGHHHRFSERAVGVIVTSAGLQAAGTTLTAVRSIIHAKRGRPTPFGAALSVNSDSFGPDGRPLEPRDAWQLDTVAAQVVQFARMRFTS